MKKLIAMACLCFAGSTYAQFKLPAKFSGKQTEKQTEKSAEKKSSPSIKSDIDNEGFNPIKQCMWSSTPFIMMVLQPVSLMRLPITA